jgi:four helix bundle protein
MGRRGMQDFRKLKVWEKAHQLTLDAYALTKPFPREEQYGLRGQIRSSSSSVAMNIAEGCGRQSDADFCRFLHVSMGSASEPEYQLLLARDLSLINKSEHQHLENRVKEVKKMIASLIQRLTADS